MRDVRLEKEDLYKFNQLIHKLDDISGGDYMSPFAAKLREVRDELFDNDGVPLPSDIIYYSKSFKSPQYPKDF